LILCVLMYLTMSAPSINLSISMLFHIFHILSNATTCPSWTSGLPSWLWPKCNQHLRLGSPWGAVMSSRWGGWWYMNMEYQEGP
jgi:hypothetical protein